MVPFDALFRSRGEDPYDVRCLDCWKPQRRGRRKLQIPERNPDRHQRPQPIVVFMMERKAPILFLLFSDVLIANGNAGEQPVAYSIFSVSFGCLTVPAILTFKERLHLSVFFSI